MVVSSSVDRYIEVFGITEYTYLNIISYTYMPKLEFCFDVVKLEYYCLVNRKLSQKRESAKFMFFKF